MGPIDHKAHLRLQLINDHMTIVSIDLDEMSLIKLGASLQTVLRGNHISKISLHFFPL